MDIALVIFGSRRQLRWCCIAGTKWRRRALIDSMFPALNTPPAQRTDAHVPHHEMIHKCWAIFPFRRRFDEFGVLLQHRAAHYDKLSSWQLVAACWSMFELLHLLKELPLVQPGEQLSVAPAVVDRGHVRRKNGCRASPWKCFELPFGKYLGPKCFAKIGVNLLRRGRFRPVGFDEQQRRREGPVVRRRRFLRSCAISKEKHGNDRGGPEGRQEIAPIVRSG